MDLVLGGEGLVGKALCARLRDAGREVVSLDLKNGFDLRLASADWFENADRVWFLAWDTGGAKYLGVDALQHSMYKHNSQLCLQVFDILDRQKIPFLFVSSQLAGEPSAYGITKLLGEKWALQLGGKVAKLWNVYGWEAPDQRSHVIPDLVASGVMGGVVKCGTSGEERRQLIHKADCADALIHLFDSQQNYADITSWDWIRIRDVAAVISEELSVPMQTAANAGGESLHAPAVPLAGWESRIPLLDGIRDVISEAQQWLAETQLASK